jgi:hypothetical protein
MSAAEAFFKSNHSRHAKANTTTTTPFLGQWINVCMNSSYLMIKKSRSWIVFLLLMLLVVEQVRLWARLKQPKRDYLEEQ